MKKNYLLGLMLLFAVSSVAQLTIQSGAALIIQSGATVTVQGDVTSNADIQGTGLLQLKGTSTQSLNMNGFSINTALEIDNTNHITLGGIARLAGNLTFTNGKIVLGTNNFILSSASTYSGTGTSKFVETNSTGACRREVGANGTFILPIGIGTTFDPVQFQVASASSFSSAFVSGRVLSGGHPNKHPRSTDFLTRYWSLTNSGITGGNITLTAQYNDPADITGTESNLRAMLWDGSNWSITGASQNNASNIISAPMPDAADELYAMNRFVLTTPKIFLQGPYNTSSHLMNDLLRNSGAYNPGTLPASNLIPLTDPYRSAPYNATFTHVNNTSPETIAGSVLNDQTTASNNIVDWVFVELRNTASPGNTVLQTRSALLRRDGTIVDVDGVSPLYFKNVDPATYVLAVRHRNHLGIGTSPATPLPIDLDLTNTPFDFATAATTALSGTIGSAYTNIDGNNMMWAGNANFNTNTRYTGPSNDRDYILGTILASNQSTILSNVYSEGDVNMNRTVRYTGPSNDRDFILASILGSNQSTIRNQTLPN